MGTRGFSPAIKGPRREVNHSPPSSGQVKIDGTTEGVPGGEVNRPILGSHNIGHSKEKLYMYMCPILNRFGDRATSLYSSEVVEKKQILRAVSNPDIYYSSDKVGTVYLV
jgi:hypothetical protein